jgi:hypothetical protein
MKEISHKDHKGHEAHRQDDFTTCREVRGQAVPDFAQRRKERKVTQRGPTLNLVDSTRLVISGLEAILSAASQIVLIS